MNILDFPKLVFNKSYFTISILGNSYRVNIKYSNTSPIKLIKSETEIDIYIPRKLKNNNNSKIIDLAIKKLYDDIALNEFENSLELARHILKFTPDDYKIERLKNKYYKCTKKNILIINPDIIRFNREVIDTTILQAFCKIKFKTNTNIYNKTLENALKKYEAYKASYKNNVLKHKAS